ncbi:hypothetical protein [Curtobacterium sp. KT1]|uniref:hypothetical protein n=1 Tax=Curtobacterium sp. KT1 TaxID=3372858 RepID=UPI0037C0F06D
MGVASVPHHGSRLDSDALLWDALTSLQRVTIESAHRIGGSGNHHPHASVPGELNSRRLKLQNRRGLGGLPLARKKAPLIREVAAQCPSASAGTSSRTEGHIAASRPLDRSSATHASTLPLDALDALDFERPVLSGCAGSLNGGSRLIPFVAEGRSTDGTLVIRAPSGAVLVLQAAPSI